MQAEGLIEKMRRRRVSELKTPHKMIESTKGNSMRVYVAYSASISKNIYNSFIRHSLLRRISTIRNHFDCLLLVFLSYSQSTSTTHARAFRIFLSQRDKMVFLLQTTYHLIVSQPASMFRSLNFVVVSTFCPNANELNLVNVWMYINHPQSSKLENMLTIH